MKRGLPAGEPGDQRRAGALPALDEELAAERLGDMPTATAYYTKLIEITDGTNTDRRELVAARQFLERK